MAKFNFRCVKCNQETAEHVAISARRVFQETAKCGSCGTTGSLELYIKSSAKTVSTHKGAHSQSESFKDTLREIHKSAGKESTIDV